MIKHVDIADNSVLLESGNPKKLRTTPSNGEIRIISYNIRWRSGDDLKELIKAFREDNEDWQSNDHCLTGGGSSEEASGKTNTAKLIADELGLYYAWAAPPTANKDDEEETGVALLSVYPLTDVCRLILPHKGPGGRRRAALGASIMVGNVPIRIYSAHAETRISMDEKLDQLNAVLEDLKSHSPEAPAIIMGDLNTWQSDAAPRTNQTLLRSGLCHSVRRRKNFPAKGSLCSD
jgi:endonuclease/exonuclease/phosphatase family metal-dependent hydrolase